MPFAWNFVPGTFTYPSSNLALLPLRSGKNQKRLLAPSSITYRARLNTCMVQSFPAYAKRIHMQVEPEHPPRRLQRSLYVRSQQQGRRHVTQSGGVQGWERVCWNVCRISYVTLSLPGG